MNDFSLGQAMKAQATLRDAAGAGEECFDAQQLVGMLSDEIRVLRDAGMTDETIGQFYVDTSEYQARG